MDAIGLISSLYGSLHGFHAICQLLYLDRDANSIMLMGLDAPSDVLKRILYHCNQLLDIVADLQRLAKQQRGQPIAGHLFCLELTTTNAQLDKASCKFPSLKAAILKPSDRVLGRSIPKNDFILELTEADKKLHKATDKLTSLSKRTCTASKRTAIAPSAAHAVFAMRWAAGKMKKTLEEAESTVLGLEDLISSIFRHAIGALNQDRMPSKQTKLLDNLGSMSDANSMMGTLGTAQPACSPLHANDKTSRQAHGMSRLQHYQRTWQVSQVGTKHLLTVGQWDGRHPDSVTVSGSTTGFAHSSSLLLKNKECYSLPCSQSTAPQVHHLLPSPIPHTDASCSRLQDYQLPFPSGKRDFLLDFPFVVTLNILRFLDARSICRVARVAISWKWLLDAEPVWRDLFRKRWGLLLDECEVFSDPSVKRQSQALWMGGERGDVAYEFLKRPRRWSQLQCKGDLEQKEPEVLPGEACKSSTSTSNQDQGPNGHICGELKSWKQLYAFHHCLHQAWRSGILGQQTFEGHSGPILAALTRGEHVLTASADHTIKVWSMRSQKLLRTLKGHEDAVTCLSFEGTQLISGSMDGTVRFWDYVRGIVLKTTPTSEYGGVTSLICSIRYLVTGTSGGQVLITDNDVPDRVWAMKGHDCAVKAIKLHRHDTLLSLGRDGTVKVWDLGKKICTMVMRGDLGRVGCFKPLSQLRSLAWETYKGCDGNHEHQHGTSETWKCAQELQSSKPRPKPKIVIKTRRDRIHSLREHLDPTPLSFSHLLICGYTNGVIRIWDMATSTPIREFFDHRTAISALDFDHSHLASAGEDGVFKVWDLDTGEEILEVRGAHKGAINMVKIGEFGILTAGDDGFTKFWTVTV